MRAMIQSQVGLHSRFQDQLGIQNKTLFLKKKEERERVRWGGGFTHNPNSRTLRQEDPKSSTAWVT